MRNAGASGALRPRIIALAVGALPLMTPTLSSADQLGAWTITETTSPLTNGRTVTASTLSIEELSNMLGRPQRANLVLRCREGSRAAYVVWPQVLSAPFRSALLNLPSTQVLKKLDDAKIISDLWVVSSDMTSAGSFDNLGAPKIMASLRGAKRFVVRMTSLTTSQDAVFDVAGVDVILDRIETACGGKPAAATPPAYTDSPMISEAMAGTPEAWKAAAMVALKEVGFPEVKVASQGVYSPMKPFKLTSRQVDCGNVLGLAYISDRRTQTYVLAGIRAAGGAPSVRLSILGLEKGSLGAPDKVLHCVSTGVLEHDILQRMAKQIGVQESSAAP